MVSFVEIPDCPAIGDEMSLKMPFTAKYFFHKIGVCTTGFLVGAIVGTHDSFHICLLYQGFKSGKICLPQIFFRSLGVKTVTQGFRTGVYRKMFGTGGGS